VALNRWPLITGIGHFIYKLVKEILRKAREGAPGPALGSGTDMVKCPRCYVYVQAESAISTRVEGRTFHFCSKECLEAYRRDHQDIDAAALDAGTKNNYT